MQSGDRVDVKPDMPKIRTENGKLNEIPFGFLLLDKACGRSIHRPPRFLRVKMLAEAN